MFFELSVGNGFKLPNCCTSTTAKRTIHAIPEARARSFARWRAMSSVVSRSDSELKMSFSSNAQRWRDRAVELRLLALAMKDAQCKEGLLRAAERYEFLASSFQAFRLLPLHTGRMVREKSLCGLREASQRLHSTITTVEGDHFD
jgi:hypothetical protein